MEIRNKVDSQARHREQIQEAEKILLGYIEKRKKQLAELALSTLLELDPGHPKKSEYEIWIRDLDQEVALQQRLDQELLGGRNALLNGEIEQARKHLAALRKIDSWSSLADSLAAEIAAAEEDEEQTGQIDRLKQQFEDSLANGTLTAAEQQLVRLAQLDVPKVTLDFLRLKLEESRILARDQADASELQTAYDQALTRRDWQAAREAAHQFGKRFSGDDRAARLFHQVSEMEAAERRQHSLREGISTLERFVAEGKKREAELALKLLHSLRLDPQHLSALEERVRKL